MNNNASLQSKREKNYFKTGKTRIIKPLENRTLQDT